MGNEIKTNAETKSQTKARTNYEELGDQELVARVLVGDGAAWIELMRRYEKSVRGAIFSVLRRYAVVLNGDAREDVLQQFYLSLLENGGARLRVFDEKRSKLGTWLQMIARQKAADHARKVVNRPRNVELDDLLAQEDYAVEEDPSIETHVQAPRERYDVVDAHVWWKAAQAAKKEGR